jgi:hypothetical protein
MAVGLATGEATCPKAPSPTKQIIILNGLNITQIWAKFIRFIAPTGTPSEQFFRNNYRFRAER